MPDQSEFRKKSHQAPKISVKAIFPLLKLPFSFSFIYCTSDYASPGFAGLRYMAHWRFWRFFAILAILAFLAIFLAHFDPWAICDKSL